MEFAEVFSSLVKERGMMAKVEKATGISSSLQSKYRSGQTDPTLSNAVLIADFFGVTLDELAGRTPPRGAGLSREEGELVAMYREVDARARGSIMSTARRELEWADSESQAKRGARLSA